MTTRWRAWIEVAVVCASAWIPGMPTPLVPMLIAASALRWFGNTSWGDPTPDGVGHAGIEVGVGAAIGFASFAVVTLAFGFDAAGEFAVVRGSAQALVMMSIVSVALAAAAEMIFRGFILTKVASASGSWLFGNAASALAFALVVGGSDVGAVFGLLAAGLGYGFLSRAAGNRLTMPIATHAAFTLASVWFAYLEL